MCHRSVELSILDEAAAIDGSRPLEQITDSSGYAIGRVALQMKPCLSAFSILATHSRGLTPAQQAWTPLSLEGYAQLDTRRAIKGMIGPVRSILWTGHTNLIRLQGSEEIEPKHLRWLSEFLMDGSQLWSLSGSAKLADGLSRNPENRDSLLAQRTRDLEGLIDQLRGFSLVEYFDDKSEGRLIHWSFLSDRAEVAESASRASPAVVAPWRAGRDRGD